MLLSTITSDSSRLLRVAARCGAVIGLFSRADCGCYYVVGLRPRHVTVDDPETGQPHDRRYWQESTHGAQLKYSLMIETLERCTECGERFYLSEVQDKYNPFEREIHMRWPDEPVPKEVADSEYDIES